MGDDAELLPAALEDTDPWKDSSWAVRPVTPGPGSCELGLARVPEIRGKGCVLSGVQKGNCVPGLGQLPRKRGVKPRQRAELLLSGDPGGRTAHDDLPPTAGELGAEQRPARGVGRGVAASFPARGGWSPHGPLQGPEKARRCLATQLPCPFAAILQALRQAQSWHRGERDECNVCPLSVETQGLSGVGEKRGKDRRTRREVSLCDNVRRFKPQML